MEKTSLYNIGDNFRSYLPFIRDRLPAIYREKYPLFVSFIEAYYEWLEQNTNANERLLSYELLKDSNYGADEFIEDFRSELMPFFPAATVVDNTLLIKQINEFYRSKGKPRSLEFLFRVLFNTEPVIEYPSDRIIFQSANQNNTDVIMRINYSQPPATTNIPYTGFIGRTIKGVTSGATAKVIDVVRTTLGNTTFVELSLDPLSVSATPFNINETIATIATPATPVELKGTVYGLVSSNSVTTGGTNYELLDSVVFSSQGDGVGIAAHVSKVTGGVSRIEVIDGGGGYLDGDPVVVAITPVAAGSGATATALISGGRVSSITVTSAGSGYNEGVTVVISGGSPTRLAEAKGYTKGVLQQIFFDNPGVGYQTIPPTINFSGFPRGGSGATATLTLGPLATINSHIVRYRGGTNFPEQNFNVLLVVGGGTGAFVPAEVVFQGTSLAQSTWTGVVFSWDLPTRRLIIERNLMIGFNPDETIKGNTSGAQWSYDSPYSQPIRLDANDNQVNREYTYNIKSNIPVANYNKYVKDNTHPAGMRFFGIFELIGEFVNISTILKTTLYKNRPSGINTLNSAGQALFLNTIINYGWGQTYSIEFFNPIHGTIANNQNETFLNAQNTGRVKNLQPRFFTNVQITP